MEALILLALFPVILCNPLAEVGGREAAETKALYAKVDRMLDAGSAFNVVHSDTTLYLSRGWTGTYDEAKSKCESYNGVLASLTTLRETALVDAHADELHFTSGKKANNVWKWGTGQLIRPSAKKISSNPPECECLLYPWSHDNENVFLPQYCDSTRKAICELDGLVTSNDEFEAIHVKKTFVIIRQTGINYTQAEADCANMVAGAHLATPTKLKELDLIDKSKGPIDGNADFWLGSKRENFGQRDTWVTGEPIVKNLRPWKHDNGGSCLMYLNTGEFDWFHSPVANEDGWTPDGYVCQIDL